jgi:hypothetical protein
VSFNKLLADASPAKAAQAALVMAHGHGGRRAPRRHSRLRAAVDRYRCRLTTLMLMN